LKALLTRIIINYRSSLDGLVYLLIVALTATDTSLSDASRVQRVGWAGLILAALWKALSKDPLPQFPPLDSGREQVAMTMPPTWQPPTQDKSTIRNSKLFRSLLLLSLSFSLVLSGCSKRTTLDRIGTGVVTAVHAYRIEIDQLYVAGNLSERKYRELKDQSQLALRRAEEFARRLAAFGSITPNNVTQLAIEVTNLTLFLEQLLRDAGLLPESKAIRILSFAVATLKAAAIVIAAIHPGGVVMATRDTGLARPNPNPSQVNVDLPKADKEVREAIEAAGKRATVKPSTYEPRNFKSITTEVRWAY
jgi:hypothetical protein